MGPQIIMLLKHRGKKLHQSKIAHLEYLLVMKLDSKSYWIEIHILLQEHIMFVQSGIKL
jgi:hypothetical protein